MKLKKTEAASLLNTALGIVDKALDIINAMGAVEETEYLEQERVMSAEDAEAEDAAIVSHYEEEADAEAEKNSKRKCDKKQDKPKPSSEEKPQEHKSIEREWKQCKDLREDKTELKHCMVNYHGVCCKGRCILDEERRAKEDGREEVNAAPQRFSFRGLDITRLQEQ